MRRLHLSAALFATLCGLSVPVVAAEPASPAAGLEIGIAPFLPARTLAQNYQPLRDFLEQRLREPVLIVTAPDYRIFHERIRNHEYPLLITVANSAYLAHTESGYRPLLQPLVPTRPVLVVRRSSKLKELRDLKGQTLALPNPLAIIAMQADDWLRSAGLQPGRDLQIQHHATHSAAVNHVASGSVAAAIVSDRALQQMAAGVREVVHVVQTPEQYAAPGVVYLAGPKLSPERADRLQTLIVEFSQSPAGQSLMKEWGYQALVTVTTNQLAPLAPYGQQLRSALSKAEPANGKK
jgi:phosphonate transport system substrate-binding protein